MIVIIVSALSLLAVYQLLIVAHELHEVVRNETRKPKSK